MVKQGRNVFFIGPEDTGKLVLLRNIIQSLWTKYSKYPGNSLAAQNIGDTTLHRFAGIGLSEAFTKKLIHNIRKNKLKLRRWLDIYVLIIDEISMVDCILFDKLDAITRELQRIELPFGGI